MFHFPCLTPAPIHATMTILREKECSNMKCAKGYLAPLRSAPIYRLRGQQLALALLLRG